MTGGFANPIASNNILFVLEKLTSGGQTGVDRAVLDVALRGGLDHGGWCPLGRRAEDGIIGPQYHLKETPSADPAQRTEWNVRDSDATAIFSVSKEIRGGTAKTAELAALLGRPVIHIVRDHDTCPATLLLQFILANRVRVLNVAGPRASEEPDTAEFSRVVLEQTLRLLTNAPPAR